MIHIIDSPFSMSIIDTMALSRAITKNNAVNCCCNLLTDVAFIPRLLVELGLFVSTSQVKKNKPELWRELADGEIIAVGRIIMRLHKAVI